jgi:TatD DNase family protein
MIIAGSDTPGDYDTSLAIADKYHHIHVAAGIHPHTGATATPAALDKLERALHHDKIRALGEIGLDFHYNHSTPPEQRRAFISQLRLAHKLKLPVIIHTREADEETLAILRGEGANALGGVIHCFSGGDNLAQGALELGFYISFSGIVTFPKSNDIQSIAKTIPSERILVETDTPFLAPVPKRGRVNEPAWVLHVVTTLSKLRGTTPEAMAETTYRNVLTCFGLS